MRIEHVTIYDIETGQLTDTSKAAAEIARLRNPGRYIPDEEPEIIDYDDISIDGVSLTIGGTD